MSHTANLRLSVDQGLSSLEVALTIIESRRDELHEDKLEQLDEFKRRLDTLLIASRDAANEKTFASFACELDPSPLPSPSAETGREMVRLVERAPTEKLAEIAEGDDQRDILALSKEMGLASSEGGETSDTGVKVNGLNNPPKPKLG